MEDDPYPLSEKCPSVSIILDRPAPELNSLEAAVRLVVKGQVEFVLCDPGVMRFLNRKWRKIDRPTDVLTFDLSDSSDDAPSGVVYVDGRLAPPLDAVLERMFHGYLHLCGWHHDSPEEAKTMSDETACLVLKANTPNKEKKEKQ
jgi:probable rRNA maturation factor